MTWGIAVIAFLCGSGIGALVVWSLTQRRLAAAQERAVSLAEQSTRLSADLEQARAAANEASHQAASLEERLRLRDEQFAEQKRLLEEAEKKLTAVFEATGARLLQHNSDRFIQQAERALEEKAKPIRELLDRQGAALKEIEAKRLADQTGLQKHLELLAQAHDRLGSETNRLVSALRRPDQRGRWGEMQLRNVVELAGMTEHCDFAEQVHVAGLDGSSRPDMVVNMPGGGVIVVDSKVALDAYLDALQPDADKAACLDRHARQVETHIRQLASKAYWNQFERTPKLVVMFMPLESALSAALDVRPDLHAEAMSKHVLIATPTLLVAMLRAIAYGWRQEDVAANARCIADVGRELHDRLSTFVDHLRTVGGSLDRATRSYNQAIGSLESRVLVSARRLRELRSTTAPEIEAPARIETDVREIAAPELRSLPDSADDGKVA